MKVDEALRFVHKGADLQKTHCGPLNSLYISYKFRVGLLFYYAGKVDEALVVLNEVYNASKQVNGESNARTLDTHYFIAGILMGQGKNAEARNTLELCLEPKNCVMWSEVGIAMAEYRLGIVLSALGDAAADEHINVARSTRERYLRDYPDRFGGGKRMDDQAIHDQMCSFWHGRVTSVMKQW
ncbi:hypothetical protein K505DRAFT_363966 [Melanomma pulvis-pyrius CBS 109.77]|uniref:TPR-like protein n=1 Tax=Melanomma pulvis-pyrius CBS 109.77 TaxID=1314802 RepID=A0A6A6X4Y1_9PLEO|nr:hypothetical protein K505DRAFT_363966 [Melanomma pulvis-pyrius CBS 109.77]